MVAYRLSFYDATGQRHESYTLTEPVWFMGTNEMLMFEVENCTPKEPIESIRLMHKIYFPVIEATTYKKVFADRFSLEPPPCDWYPILKSGPLQPYTKEAMVWANMSIGHVYRVRISVSNIQMALQCASIVGWMTALGDTQASLRTLTYDLDVDLPKRIESAEESLICARIAYAAALATRQADTAAMEKKIAELAMRLKDALGHAEM